jgi:type VI protein secretion system component VasK
MSVMERQEVADRQLDALLQRLDRLCDEVHQLSRKLDTQEGLLRISHELATLNESLQALAYAALGQQAPSVRRRRTG